MSRRCQLRPIYLQKVNVSNQVINVGGTFSGGQSNGTPEIFNEELLQAGGRQQTPTSIFAVDVEQAAHTISIQESVFTKNDANPFLIAIRTPPPFLAAQSFLYRLYLFGLAKTSLFFTSGWSHVSVSAMISLSASSKKEHRSSRFGRRLLILVKNKDNECEVLLVGLRIARVLFFWSSYLTDAITESVALSYTYVYRSAVYQKPACLSYPASWQIQAAFASLTWLQQKSLLQ